MKHAHCMQPLTNFLYIITFYASAHFLSSRQFVLPLYFIFRCLRMAFCSLIRQPDILDSLKSELKKALALPFDILLYQLRWAQKETNTNSMTTQCRTDHQRKEKGRDPLPFRPLSRCSPSYFIVFFVHLPLSIKSKDFSLR